MTHRIGRDKDITRRRSEGRQPQQVMDEEERYIVAPEPRPQQPQFTRGSYDMSLMVSIKIMLLVIYGSAR